MNGGSPDYEMSLDLPNNLVDLTGQANQLLVDNNAPLQWSWVTDPSPFQETLSFSRHSDQVNTLTISGSEGMFVEVNMQTGEHKFGEHYTPTKAAETFWTAIGTVYTSAVTELTQCRDALEQVAKTLNVRNGESIVLTAQARMEHIEWLRRRNDELGLQLRILANEPGDQLIKDLTNDPTTDIIARTISLTRTHLPQKVQAKTNFDDAMKVARDL